MSPLGAILLGLTLIVGPGDDSYSSRYDAFRKGGVSAQVCEVTSASNLEDAALIYRRAMRESRYPDATRCIEEIRRLLDEGHEPKDELLRVHVERMPGVRAWLEGRKATSLALEAPER